MRQVPQFENQKQEVFYLVKRMIKDISIIVVIALVMAISKPDRYDFANWAGERNVNDYYLDNFFVVNLLTSKDGDIAIGVFKNVFTLDLHKESRQ
ncbi:hypothetical protein [Cohnella luojiensis]|uniref:Uncharacterized protein n=1 Tax=Cohnella luojiensis TaxID=652876 RepID=A0A4Y8LR47_9BACL|nr:hypothetical protein [Cohnella luojiensis]TFE19739.1 hypothetical protein E2980_22305 [Cohnella luojiensis]